MSLVSYPASPSVDGTALVVFAGEPNIAVEWSLMGNGFLTPQSGSTDARGIAAAIYQPTVAGDMVTISVTHGA